ncbi:protein Hook homolog 2-like [Seriola lalandi dorsalis]|uniref:protein Hook homolog 2-like n=1 Tax=Seriola lalandi dorsalis TaxID=1841481 RepID=UPI000C6F8A9D|nr:protein Hook homolog 2-like [Seriola lalandi dorsalis]
MTTNKDVRPFDTMTTPSPEDSTRSRQEQEETLILTAWKSMSSALQRHSLCEDSGAQSFLAKQRQSTQARRVLSPPAAAQVGGRGREREK